MPDARSVNAGKGGSPPPGNPGKKTGRPAGLTTAAKKERDKKITYDRVVGNMSWAGLALAPPAGVERWSIGYPLTAEDLEVRPAERVPLFRPLVEGAVADFFLPWLETVEAKGEIVRRHFVRMDPRRPARSRS